MSDSYTYIAKKIDGERIDEHRYIMEQFLGRKLDRYEVVHHKNGDKRDNRIENLEVMPLAEHTRKHLKGKPLSEEHRKKLSESNLGQKSPNRTLSDEAIRAIRSNYIPFDKEYGSRALGRKYGISHVQILKILNRKIYKDVS